MNRLSLPVEIEDLGDTITIKRGDTGEYLGYADQAEGEIVISDRLTTLGEVDVLIHEILHLIEGSALAQGMIKEPITHEFIEAAGFGLSVILARCGAIRTVDPESVDAEIAAMVAEDTSDV